MSKRYKYWEIIKNKGDKKVYISDRECDTNIVCHAHHVNSIYLTKTEINKLRKSGLMQEKRYIIEVNKSQLELISLMSDRMARLLIGQLDKGLDPILFNVLYKKHKGFTDECYKEKEQVESLIEKIREICFNQKGGQFNGVGYSETADVLIDINEVIRHFLYKERGDTTIATVDAYEPSGYGNEPLITIKRI